MKKLKFDLILASKSPRRQHLLKELGFDFTVKTKDTDESFPSSLKGGAIPLFLCQKKAAAFHESIGENELLITADTVVWVHEEVLNKPHDAADAVRMLHLLSGKMHEVFTGVCLKSKSQTKSFVVATKVYFKELKKEEIDYYVSTYKPFDKAGAYGAQEWIGYIAVEKIDGSYFNVMGLPVKELYDELMLFN